MLPIKLICEKARQRRISRLLRELEGYERAMRDRCAQVIELTEVGDDIHVECLRVLESLDGQS